MSPWRMPWRMLGLTLRALLSSWPALAAWFIGGQLVHYWVIQLAGFLGAFHSLAGVLLMPVAVAAKLIAIVAMLLTLRDALAQLAAIAPPPQDAAARRRSFTNALIAGVLPFIGFYALQGYLREDWFTYIRRAMEVRVANQLSYTEAEGLEVREWGFHVGEIVMGWSVVTLIVAAFVLRSVLGRLKTSYPRATAPAVVYLETLWILPYHPADRHGGPADRRTIPAHLGRGGL